MMIQIQIIYTLQQIYKTNSRNTLYQNILTNTYDFYIPFTIPFIFGLFGSRAQPPQNESKTAIFEWVGVAVIGVRITSHHQRTHTFSRSL